MPRVCDKKIPARTVAKQAEIDRLKRQEPVLFRQLVESRAVFGQTRLSIKWGKPEPKEEWAGLDFKRSRPFIER